METFDTAFYNEYYGCASNFKQFQEDCIHDGRFTHPCILDDNFDYGLFFSKLNWVLSDTSFIKTKDDSLQYYLENRAQYKKWFESPHIDIKHFYKTSNTACVYYCYLDSDLSTDTALLSLSNISQSIPIENIFIVIYGEINSKYYRKIREYYKNTFSLKSTIDIIKAKSFEDILYADNTNVVYQNIDKFLQTYLNSKYNIFSIHDKYSIMMNNKPFYGLNNNFFIFKKTLFSKIINIINLNRHNSEYYITKFCIENNIDIGYFFYISTEKEIFWKELFTYNILQHKILTDHHKIPILNSQVYDFNKISNKVPDSIRKLLCCIHLGNTSDKHIEDIKAVINKLQSYTFIDVDFFITSDDNIESLNIKPYIVPNKGADIGPFMQCLHNHHKKDEYDYILKLHTKTNHGFRRMVFMGLVDNLLHNITMIENENEACMVGLNNYKMQMDQINEPILSEICSKYKLSSDNTYFIAGTMFLAKYNFFVNVLEDLNISILSEYQNLESGYFKNHDPTYTHSWERILSGVLPHNLKQKVLYI
jgi:hypothetical protein